MLFHFSHTKKNHLHSPKKSQKESQHPSPCVALTPKSNTLSSEHYFIV